MKTKTLFLRSISVLIVLFLSGATAFAGVLKKPYLIYEGQNSAMTVLWQDDAVETTNVISWGTDTTYSMGSANVAEYGTSNQHKYTITGLQPSTKYYYQVTASAGGTVYGAGSFVTAPADIATAVKFLAFGDTRSNPLDMESVITRMRAEYAADPAYQSLTLQVGDWVASDGESNWTTEWFNANPQTRALLAETPINGAKGNHEGTGTYYKKYYPYPYVGNFYWSFDYGPVHFTVVDQYATYTAGSAQYNWIVNDLATTTKPWKILLMHEPMYSAGTHANNTTSQNVFLPLIDQHNVDLVLTGHNHNYARAMVNGVPHIVDGGGGAPLYAVDTTWPNVVTATSALSYAKFDVNGNTLVMTAKKADGTVIDSITLTHSTGAPAAPTGLTATAGNDQVSLSWTASSGATSYNVKRATVSGGPYTTVASGVTSTSITNTGLTNGTTYYYVVTAVNANGESGNSNQASATPSASTPVTVTSQVNSGNDDVEERQTGGTMYNNSSDLELVYDSSTTGNQYVGMRFTNVNVPKGKTITNAYIQFTVDEVTTGACNVTIKGQAADNPGTFTTAAYNVSSRAKTAAAVSWAPAAWSTVDQAGTAQRTPDLNNIVQEIVNRAGWAQNNSMVFIVTGTGKRTARAYESGAAKAPKLVITYQ